MEKVKEESRRKSEELEMLRRTMAQNGVQQPVETRSSYTRVEETKPSNTDAYEDYVMDFSKPAGYHPPRRDPDESASHIPPRQRSVEPASLADSPAAPPAVPPPIPPPPRRTQSVDAGSPQRRRDPPQSTPVPSDATTNISRQRSLLMEEIRRSANARILRKSSE